MLHRTYPDETRGAPTIVRELTPEFVSAVISDIYDCALDPALWPATLSRITQQADAAYLALSLLEKDTGQSAVAATSPWDPLQLRILHEKFASQNMIPGSQAMLQGELDTPNSTLNMVPEADFHATRFYREWAQPQGLRDGCMAKFAETDELIGMLSYVTRANRDIVSAEERRFIQLLCPHFRRAALIGKLLDQQALEVALYRSTLDGLSTAVFLVDWNARIMHANGSGESLLRSNVNLTALEGKLVARQPVLAEALADAVARAASADTMLLGGRGIGIPLSAMNEPPMVAYVLPMAQSDVRQPIRNANVAVFVTVAGGYLPPPTAILMTLFELTPAEARVMVESAAGRSNLEVAETLNVSENTVKTHLSRVFAKAGIARHGELVKLVASISPP